MYLVFCLHVCLCNMCVPGTREAREGHEILWGSRRLWASTWELGNKLRSRATGSLSSELSLHPTTRHSRMDLELIVKAVVPSDQCDSWRNWVIFTEMIAISSQTEATYIIIKKKDSAPFVVITCRRSTWRQGQESVASGWDFRHSLAGFLTSLQSVILSWPDRHFIWYWWHFTFFRISFLHDNYIFTLNYCSAECG